ncbi:phage tail tape measure protein [Brevibacterium sp. p3-SID960]|uniref:phage tail tape measure protein n=1 Tax=Brevibacterium sp. p3-SID960 TaxID=2916063 RepID=UPI0021A4C1A5|nr:phage tail tape measure protein [Brevibacterium sp. p3-SID960]MCT1689862.1 phage tail tape measure protein [Brevibacterium sp. p3-SID960]
MVSARTVSVILRAEIGKFRADMQTAGQVASEAARKTETAWDKSTSSLGRATQAIQQHSGEMTTAGTVLAGFGTVVVGSLGLATKAAMSWESAWTGVLKTVDGTPKQLAAVEEGLRGLAKTLPATHEEIAAVAEAAGQLGIKTDNVVAFTKTMIDMGESTNLSAEEAATGLARFSNIMRTQQRDVGKLGAAIVGLGNNFATTEAEILGMSMRIAGAGKQAGLTEGDVLGLATALSSVGIEAEAGGTAISLVMKKITNSVAAGDDRLALFAKTAGMTSEQFSKAWAESPSAAMTSFVDGLGKADAAGQNVNETLSALGVTGIRESDALLRLSSNAELLEKAFKTGNDEFERGTALAEEAAKRYENAESKMKMAGNSIKDTAITIGGTFLPMLATGMEAVAGFADIVGQVPAPLLQIASAGAAVVGTLALLAGGALILIPRLTEVFTAFQTLNKAGIVTDSVMGSVTAAGRKAAPVLGKVAKGAGLVAVGFVTAQAAGAILNATLDTTSRTSSEMINKLALLDEATRPDTKGSLLDPAIWEEANSFWVKGIGAENIETWGDAFKRSSDEATGWLDKMMGVRSDVSILNDTIAETDVALTSLADSGSFDKAAAGFRAIAEQSPDMLPAEVLDRFPTFRDHLVGMATEMGLAADDTTLVKLAMGEIQPNAQGASDAIGGMGDAAETTAESLSKMLDGLLALGLATLSERDAMRQYEEAIDGISESIKENGTSLDITTEKGRANQEALDAIADKGFRVAQSMAEAGASQEDVQGHLQRTYDDLIAAAGQFGITGKAAEDMAREVMGIPDNVDVKTWMDDAAEEQAKNTKDAVNDIPKNVNITAVLTYYEDKSRLSDLQKKYPGARIPAPPTSGAPASKSQKPNRKVTTRRSDLWHDGGLAIPMAAGALTSMQPIAQMVPPNTWRVVGDRMDVDEAFIPLDGSRRSWRILAESMRRMPGVMPMARGGVASAQSRVDDAQSALTRARRQKSDAKSKAAKQAAERRVRVAQDELDAAKRSLAAAKKRAQEEERAAKLAAERRKAEQERRARVNELRSDFRTDVRRGSLRDQVTGGLSGAYSAVDRMFGLGKNEDLSKRARSTATSSARRFEANLRRLYGQAEKLDERLKDAKDKASELEGIQKSVASGLMSGRTLDMGDYQTFSGGQWNTHTGVAGATRRMSADVGQLRQFADKLTALRKAGVPGAILQEIAAAGPAEGITLADAFLDASGAERKSYIGLWSDYEKQANRIGQIVTEGFHKGGVNAAQGVVKGIESQKKNVENQIASLARQMEATFKNVLGIRSPSTVMAELGANTAEGLTVGIMSQLGGVQAAATAMAEAAIPAMGAIPVTVDALPEASTVMADMSAQTLTAMQSMRDAVSLSMTEQQTQTETSQQGMATATQLAQQTMGTTTQLAQQGMTTATQLAQQAMGVATQTSQAQARQATAAEQATMLTAVRTNQAGMLADTRLRQSEMLTGTRASFAQMRQTGITETQTLRSVNAATQSGMRADHSAHMGVMRDVNRQGFHSMRDTGITAFRGLRDGMHGQMQAARPVLGSDLNRLIDVLGKFTKEVNSAFGDVGVKLNAPKPLAFREGGTLPGYTPRRDVHTFYSPTGGIIEASGGESFMVPEWTRAMGGPAAIKEQNRAARQGRLDDLLHMQTQRFADGGVWRNLWAMTKAQFPNARLTSAYRPGSITASGNRSYHGRGMAIDVSPSMDIFNWWRNNYGAQLAELIYSPANGKQIKNGRNYMYTGAVRSMHYNHVHIAAVKALSEAMAGGLPGFGGFDGPMYPFLDKVGVSAGTNLEKAYRDAAAKHLTRIRKNISLDGLNPTMAQMARGIMDKAAVGLTDKAAAYGKQNTFAMPGGSGVARWRDTVIQALQRAGLPTTDDYVNAWLRQIKTESGGNPSIRQQVRDVNSGGNEAMGLVQVIPGTFAAFRDKSLPNDRTHPLANLVAGMNWAKYKANRRGRSMLSFIGKGHGYEDGTEAATRGWALVGEQGPELVNFHGGEQVIPHDQLTPEVMSSLRLANTTSTAGAGSIDYDRLAKAVVDNLPPSLVVNNDNAGLIETRIAKKTVQEFADTQALYGGGF